MFKAPWVEGKVEPKEISAEKEKTESDIADIAAKALSAERICSLAKSANIREFKQSEIQEVTSQSRVSKFSVTTRKINSILHAIVAFLAKVTSEHSAHRLRTCASVWTLAKCASVTCCQQASECAVSHTYTSHQGLRKQACSCRHRPIGGSMATCTHKVLWPW